MNILSLIKRCGVATLLLLGFAATARAERPNILWIIVDDMSANFSCYG